MLEVKYIITIGISHKYKVYAFKHHGVTLTYLQRYCQFWNTCDTTTANVACPLQSMTI